MTEEILLSRLQKGDSRALNSIMAQYGPYVQTIAANITIPPLRPEDVEEVSSDVFLALWQHADELRAGSLKPWLGTVARNRAKSWLRVRRELPMDLDELELPDDGPSLEDEAGRKELAAAVRRAVDSLRPRDREIFLRYYFYLQPMEAIAAELGLAPASVRSRLSRGRALLRKKLEKEVRA